MDLDDCISAEKAVAAEDLLDDLDDDDPVAVAGEESHFVGSAPARAPSCTSGPAAIRT